MIYRICYIYDAKEELDLFPFFVEVMKNSTVIDNGIEQ